MALVIFVIRYPLIVIRYQLSAKSLRGKLLVCDKFSKLML